MLGAPGSVAFFDVTPVHFCETHYAELCGAESAFRYKNHTFVVVVKNGALRPATCALLRRQMSQLFVWMVMPIQSSHLHLYYSLAGAEVLHAMFLDAAERDAALERMSLEDGEVHYGVRAVPVGDQDVLLEFPLLTALTCGDLYEGHSFGMSSQNMYARRNINYPFFEEKEMYLAARQVCACSHTNTRRPPWVSDVYLEYLHEGDETVDVELWRRGVFMDITDDVFLLLLEVHVDQPPFSDFLALSLTCGDRRHELDAGDAVFTSSTDSYSVYAFVPPGCDPPEQGFPLPWRVARDLDWPTASVGHFFVKVNLRGESGFVAVTCFRQVPPTGVVA